MIAQFTPTLFWDTDINSFLETTHAGYIIVRMYVGYMGRLASFKKVYGIDKIQSELLSARSLDPKTLNYFSLILNIPKEKYLMLFLSAVSPKALELLTELQDLSLLENFIW
ncbi:MAG: hypothetical protein IPP38_14575 [Bacteroidetes bacterium]|nr:hypothetical protein [Bacteroidota bacterium]